VPVRNVFDAFDEFLRELIVEGALEGLASARARGRVGGRPAALDAHGVEMARALYEMKDDDGKRRYTVQRIADRLGVSRATIYRHLNPDKPVSAEEEHGAAPGPLLWRQGQADRRDRRHAARAHALRGTVRRLPVRAAGEEAVPAGDGQRPGP
jgi:hypothetical protein